MYDPFLTEETFFVATKCCLVKDGQILIVRENRPGKSPWWELPGWKISKSDRDILPIESLARELREELGHDYWILSWNPVLFMVHKSYEEVTFSNKKIPFMFLCYVYEICAESSIELSREHSEFRWINLEEIQTIEWWRQDFDTIVHHAFTYVSKNSLPLASL